MMFKQKSVAAVLKGFTKIVRDLEIISEEAGVRCNEIHVELKEMESERDDSDRLLLNFKKMLGGTL